MVERLSQGLQIQDVLFLEHRVAEPVQVVIGHNSVSGLQQTLTDMVTDKTRASSNQESPHNKSFC
jgi:hypothetical protein